MTLGTLRDTEVSFLNPLIILVFEAGPFTELKLTDGLDLLANEPHHWPSLSFTAVSKDAHGCKGGLGI